MRDSGRESGGCWNLNLRGDVVLAVQDKMERRVEGVLYREDANITSSRPRYNKMRLNNVSLDMTIYPKGDLEILYLLKIGIYSRQ